MKDFDIKIKVGKSFHNSIKEITPEDIIIPVIPQMLNPIITAVAKKLKEVLK